MKQKQLKTILSLTLVITMILSIVSLSLTATSAVQTEDNALVSAGSGEFEEFSSYLTKEEYLKLGINSGSAQSMDANQNINPLLGEKEEKYENGVAIKYTGNVTYGWSNPQLISVMMSAPYWNELYYGEGMTAPGDTSITLSSSYGSQKGDEYTENVGISITGDCEVSVAGSGVVFGGGLAIESTSITNTVAEKIKSVEVSLVGGANTDNAVISVTPLAIYEYEVTENGNTSTAYTQVPLGTVFSVTSLDNYNSVAKSVNARFDNTQMLIVDMDDIYSGYTEGDPSTYFKSAEDMPSSYKVIDGRLIPQDVSPDIEGYVYSSTNVASVAPSDALSSETISYSGSSSNSTTCSNGYTLNPQAYTGLKLGAEVLSITATSTFRVGFSSEVSTITSTAEIYSKAIKASVTYADLPSNATEEYSFSASLIVWTPTKISDDISGCPACIIASATNMADEYPLYLPDDLHVSAVGKRSITLSWTNPDFASSTYKNRMPEKYVINSKAVGNTEDSAYYEPIKSIDANCESVTLYNLTPSTSYTFALSATSENRESVVGPAVTITTSGDDMPAITSHPEDVLAEIGETAVLSIEASMTHQSKPVQNHYLTYQWQKLSLSRYGAIWEDVDKEENSTLEININDINATELDGTVYRCVVKETRGASVFYTVSDCATLNVVHKIESFEDLCEVATLINEGNSEYAKYHYVLTNDIVFPESTQWTTPIGTSENPFMGTFDGNGHTISGLNVYEAKNYSEYYGLFGVIKNAEIRNLTLENIDITITCKNTGAICGYAENSALVNCSVDGTVTTARTISLGGLCGNTGASVFINCINYSEVSASNSSGGTGGICGMTEPDDKIIYKNCANVGNVINWDNSNLVAGICGYSYGNIEIRNCYNYGTLTSNASAAVKACPLIWDDDSIVINSYYLDTSVNTSKTSYYQGTSKTAEAFANGEVAYLLNNGECLGSQVWYQNIDNVKYEPDMYPMFERNGWNTVYKVDRENETYSNSYYDYVLGDVNLDGEINIMDSTELQRYLAKLTTFNSIQMLAADTDKDRVISISDATRIQLYLALFVSEF